MLPVIGSSGSPGFRVSYRMSSLFERGEYL